MANPSSRTVTSKGTYLPAFLNGGIAMILSLLYLPAFFDPKVTTPLLQEDHGPNPTTTTTTTNPKR
jgi:hypothetical protein